MARLSRLLSAVSLGIVVTAAIGAAVVGVENTKVHRTPKHLAESTGSGRVIVKFKAGASVLATTTRTALSATSAQAPAGPRAAGVMGGRLGLAMTDGRALDERTQVLMASGTTSSALASSIAADPDVEWVQVDHRRFVQSVPVNDPLYPQGLSTTVAPNGPASGQWYLRSQYSETVNVIDANGVVTPTLENVVSGIDVEPAWAITHGSASIVIADIDTGITAHPDLSSKLFAATFSGTTSTTPYGYDFVGYANGTNALAIANDGSLADPDPSDPGDWVTGAENANKNGPFYECNDGDYPDNPPGSSNSVLNSSWHGTQTAGILAAATNNGAGMAGTGYNAMVVPVRALGKCGGFDSDIIAAAKWAGGIAVSGVPTNTHPARVINMSLGGSGTCATDAPAYIDALTQLRNKGVVAVVAAGNDNGFAVDVPANCKPAPSDTDQTPIVIAVAGLRHAGDKVGYSDIGNEVTIAAPAGNCVNALISTNHQCLYPILTTLNSGTTTPVTNGGIYSDGVNYSAGTSFATPLVAGTVSLMLSAAPNLTNLQVINILKSTARPFPTTSDTTPTPPVCTVPTSSSAEQDECICTTSTCGAGMLDAGAAVTAAVAAATATPPTAAISPTAPTVTAGSTVTLSGTGSTAGSSGTALTYKWSIPDADTFITLGSTTGSSVVVTGVSAGTGKVTLTVTDPSNDLTSTSTVNVTVTGTTSTGTGSTSSGGGGGGAANPAWLAALAVAGLLLRPRARRPRG